MVLVMLSDKQFSGLYFNQKPDNQSKAICFAKK
jgi:hypothetical protein